MGAGVLASEPAQGIAALVANGGAPGTDGIEVTQLRNHFETNWPDIRHQLDAGTYRPQPVRRVTIPKPGGGMRDLGVPTVMDRLICQAVLQVLVPVFDPNFSETSFGFRPKRSAHMAVTTAKGFIEEGRNWVVDIDLDSFFDRVNHDALMARVARKVGDKLILKLIRAYLNAGVMVEGVKVSTTEGTPQGEHDRGNAPRRTPVTVARQHHARRPRQRARAQRPQLRPLRR